MREPVTEKNCLLLCAGVLVTRQALIGRPARSSEIRTTMPLPSRLVIHLFSCLFSCSLALTLLLILLLFMLLFSPPLFSLLFFFEMLLSSSLWIVLRAFFRSILLVHEFSFVYHQVGGRSILGAVFHSSSLFRRLSYEAPHFFTNTCPVRILVKSLVAAVISQVFKRPSRCELIGCLMLVAPTTILIKVLSTVPFSLVCGSVGRCFLLPCVLLSSLYRLNLHISPGLILQYLPT